MAFITRMFKRPQRVFIPCGLEKYRDHIKALINSEGEFWTPEHTVFLGPIDIPPVNRRIATKEDMIEEIRLNHLPFIDPVTGLEWSFKSGLVTFVFVFGCKSPRARYTINPTPICLDPRSPAIWEVTGTRVNKLSKPSKPSTPSNVTQLSTVLEPGEFEDLPPIKLLELKEYYRRTPYNFGTALNMIRNYLKDIDNIYNHIQKCYDTLEEGIYEAVAMPQRVYEEQDYINNIMNYYRNLYNSKASLTRINDDDIVVKFFKRLPDIEEALNSIMMEAYAKFEYCKEVSYYQPNRMVKELEEHYRALASEQGSY